MVGPSMSSMPPWRGMQLEWFFKTWTSSNWTTLVLFFSRLNSRAPGRNQRPSSNVLQQDATSSCSTSHILKGHVHVPHISWALFQVETGLLSVSLLKHIYLQEQINKYRVTAEKVILLCQKDSFEIATHVHHIINHNYNSYNLGQPVVYCLLAASQTLSNLAMACWEHPLRPSHLRCFFGADFPQLIDPKGPLVALEIKL